MTFVATGRCLYYDNSTGWVDRLQAFEAAPEIVPRSSVATRMTIQYFEWKVRRLLEDEHPEQHLAEEAQTARFSRAFHASSSPIGWWVVGSVISAFCNTVISKSGTVTSAKAGKDAEQLVTFLCKWVGGRKEVGKSKDGYGGVDNGGVVDEGRARRGAI